MDKKYGVLTEQGYVDGQFGFQESAEPESEHTEDGKDNKDK